jgi:hypothetical protein
MGYYEAAPKDQEWSHHNYRVPASSDFISDIEKLWSILVPPNASWWRSIRSEFKICFPCSLEKIRNVRKRTPSLLHVGRNAGCERTGWLQVRHLACVWIEFPYETGCPKVTHGFQQSYQENARSLPWNKDTKTSFPIISETSFIIWNASTLNTSYIWYRVIK